jgi:hypothetical protein
MISQPSRVKSTVPFGDFSRAGISDAEVPPADCKKTWVDDVDDRHNRLTSAPGRGRSKVFLFVELRTCGPLIQRFFSRKSDFQGSGCDHHFEFVRHFNGGHLHRRSKPSIYFLVPGGIEMSAAFEDDTGVPATKTFSEVSEDIFFLASNVLRLVSR